MEMHELIAQLIDEKYSARFANVRYPTQSEYLDKLFEALSIAQGSFSIAINDSVGHRSTNRYPSLTELISASRPALKENGLAITMEPIVITGEDFLYSRLGHKSGQFIASATRIPMIKKDDMSEFSKNLAWMQRLAYKSILGIANDEEDGSSAQAEQTSTEKKPEAPKPDPNIKINKTQFEELDLALRGHDDILTGILTALEITSLFDVPQIKYRSVMDRIQKIKAVKASK